MIDLYNDRTQILIEELNRLFGVRGAMMAETKDQGMTGAKFAGGNNLFMINRFSAIEWFLLDMQDDYGMLPYPKLDESTDNYYTAVDIYDVSLCVPVTVSDPAPVSAVLESMACEGCCYVKPAYLEQALKIKYSRDDTASRVIDIILDNCRIDFLFVERLGGLGNVFSDLVKKGSTDLASYYQKKLQSAEKNLAKMIDSYNESTGA